MKKLIALLLCCMLVLTGCAGTTVVVGECTCPPGSHDAVETPTEAATEAPVATEAPAVSESAALKTGLAIVPALSGTNATAEENGKVSYDVTVVAVTVDEAGVIASCVIDSVGVDAGFDATGTPAAEGTTEVLSKNEKGFDYGMVKYNASAIGKEWFEQVATFCEYVTGKTAAEVAGIAINETTAPADVDLAAGCSIAIGGFQNLIAEATK